MRRNSSRPIIHGRALAAEDFTALHELAPSGSTSSRKLAVTYQGAFEYHVGGRHCWVDPTRLLFVEAAEEYRDRHALPGIGHSSVLIAPGEEMFEQLSQSVAPAYADRVRPCSPKVQMLAQLLRHSSDPLMSEELGTEIVRLGFSHDRTPTRPETRSVRRAKELLHDRSGERVTLHEIASEVGVTPIYLTQAFRRSEGLPLYRYQSRLRLARALVELPRCDDIIELAVRLGYSSHSHFTAAFRQAFGTSPSGLRRVACSRRLHELSKILIV